MLTTPSACANCNTTGLPILPVRYTVVPTELKPTMPSGISGERVKDVALDSKQYQYGLRTLRGGFVYLFYEKGARGKNYWEVYAVSHDGHLTSFVASPEPPESIFCENNKHNVPRTAYICIESPEKCGKVWIAFTQRLWRVEAFNQYTTDAALRAKRMQSIMPADWINAPQHPHAAEATQANLEHILEYRTDLPQTALSPNTIKEISKKDGSYEPVQLRKQTTRYPAYMRNATVNDKGQAITPPESKHTVRLMQGSGKRPQGGSHPPMLLALWDGIGITHEMNGYRNEAVGRIKQYTDEREVQIVTLTAIEGAKVAIADKAEAWVETKEDLFKDQRMLDPKFFRDHAQNLPQPQRALRLDDISLLDQWNAQEVPTKYGTSLNQLIGLYSQSAWQNPKSLPGMVARRDEARNPIIQQVNEYLRTRGPKKQAAIKQARAESWPKYEEKLNRDAFNGFKKNYDDFMSSADQLIEKRTVDLIKWLEAPLFIDNLEDFNGSNLEDGIDFDYVVGTAIDGITSCKCGADKIDEWVKSGRASIKTNLIWRAIALNQREAITEIDKALQIAQQPSSPLSSDAWDNAGAQVKWNKIAELYKKAISLHNANHKPGVISQVNTRYLDKVLITVGDLFMKPFAKVADTVNEKAIQSVLLLRAGAKEATVLGLVDAQARYEGVSRKRLVQRINATRAFAVTEITEERSKLNKAWSALKSTADTVDSKGAFNAAKEMRLGLVVAILEGVNLWKVSQSVTQDPKVQLQLRAAKMALSAAAIDVAANAVKGLASDSALSFQVLKVSGGVLSSGASFIGGWMDGEDAYAKIKGGKYKLATVYTLRSITQFGGGVFTILITVSYADPLLQQLAKRYATTAAIQTASRLTGWALAARAGLMLTGLGFSVATLAITVAVWYFSDDALQEWCEKCVFGAAPDRNSITKKPEDQMQAFDKALIDVR